MNGPPAVQKLTACLAKLPGVGRRSAERMALRLVRDPDGLLQDLIRTLRDAGASVVSCERCGTVTVREQNPCRLCSDPGRDDGILCVVEDPSDILKIEEAGVFRGRYHALMGKLSPMRGSGPGELRIRELCERVKGEGVREVLLALNTDVESDATAAFIVESLSGSGIRVSRLAFGLPAGSGIAYADEITLARAIRGRQDV